jgi:hypothetical protein
MENYTLEYHAPGKVTVANKITLRTFRAADDGQALRMARALTPTDHEYEAGGENWKVWRIDPSGDGSKDILLAD